MRIGIRAIVLLGLLGCGLHAADRLDYRGQEPPGSPEVIVRGVMNLTTCWIELPRDIVYEGIDIPLAGAVWGAIKGSGLTLARAVAGITDLMSFGFSGEGMYGRKLPYFVWEQKWVPGDGNDGGIVVPPSLAH